MLKNTLLEHFHLKEFNGLPVLKSTCTQIYLYSNLPELKSICTEIYLYSYYLYSNLPVLKFT